MPLLLSSVHSFVVNMFQDTLVEVTKKMQSSLIGIYTVYLAQRTAVPLISIISGTGSAIWSKANFGPTGHNHP
jgi:hypothetical protein